MLLLCGHMSQNFRDIRHPSNSRQTDVGLPQRIVTRVFVAHLAYLLLDFSIGAVIVN